MRVANTYTLITNNTTMQNRRESTASVTPSLLRFPRSLKLMGAAGIAAGLVPPHFVSLHGYEQFPASGSRQKWTAGRLLRTRR